MKFCGASCRHGLAPNYLKRIGFRLPTEAEWEYACRAGTTGKRFCGNADELLSKYAHVGQFRLFPVGQLRPNDLGVFDMYGNAREWCMEPFGGPAQPYKGASPAKENEPLADEEITVEEKTIKISDNVLQGVRGSAYYEPASEHFSARRFALKPNFPAQEVGFRIARTLGPEE